MEQNRRTKKYCPECGRRIPNLPRTYADRKQYLRVMARARRRGLRMAEYREKLVSGELWDRELSPGLRVEKPADPSPTDQAAPASPPPPTEPDEWWKVPPQA